MANIPISEQKATPQEFLTMPEFSFHLRSNKVYVRFKLAGKDTKMGLFVKLKNGETIDEKTGIIDGNQEDTHLVLTYFERLKSAYKRSILAGKEPPLEMLKGETFGISYAKLIPTLNISLERYFQHQYGEKVKLDKKIKEKNGYSFRYVQEWIKVEFVKNPNVELIDIKPIHAEKLLNYVMQSKKVSKEHSRRTVGFLDRTLQFAVKSGWLTTNPFQYVLVEKTFSRQRKEIENFLTIEELEKMENVKIHVAEMAKIRDWFVLACHIGLDWHTFIGLRKSWIKQIDEDNYYLDGNRWKQNGERFEPFIVPLNMKAKKLITVFLENHSNKDDLLFPSMPTNSHVNRLLKSIAVMAGVKRPISFNWGRKTFATNAINYGIRAEIIQQMMGHRKLDTTLSYYAKLDKKTILKEGIFNN